MDCPTSQTDGSSVQRMYHKRTPKIGKPSYGPNYQLIIIGHSLGCELHQTSPPNMLKDHFKIAWRNLLHHKAFAGSNLLSLTIGTSYSILIFFWIHDEVSYDKLHSNYSNIYQIIANRNFNNHVFTDPNMVFPITRSLDSGYPDIKYAVEITYPEDHNLKYSDA
jgi:hypothetical protein